MIGRVIADRFELVERIGLGGQSFVYRAHDLAGGEDVAVKLARHGEAGLEAEAEHLASVAHPRVVRLIEAGRYAAWGEAYLVLELLEGETLTQRLDRQALTLDEVLVLGRAVATGLGALHDAGIAHGDVKPGNLILPAGRLDAAMVVDLGVACTIGLCRPKSPAGTPGYTSPEQARGAPADPRSDVFGLGCVLFKCITGRNAYRGTDPVAVMARMMVEPPPRPSAANTPPELIELVASMLAKYAGDRPDDGAAVLAALWSIPPLTPCVLHHGP